MSRVAEAANEENQEKVQPDLDSKYRLIIVAAQRSKQLQRGARPRVDIDPQKHKPTRIALEEILRQKVHFTITDNKQKKDEEK
jgi:DNA-directed RNA polymerase subunit omega